jgi:4-carboxymuconolactone decarboxylase
MSLLPVLQPGEGDDAQNAFLAAVPPLNLFKTLASAPVLGELTARFGGAILFGSELDPKLRELAILRTAHLAANAYEIGHHERIGRDVGLTDAQIAAARTGERAGLGELEALALDWAEDVLAHKRVTQANARRGVDLLGPKQAVELSLTIGYYLMVAAYLSTFQVPFEGAEFQDGVKVQG